MRTIRILVLTLILLLSLASQVSADSGEGRSEIKEVNGYEVTLSFVDGDAHLGQNNLHVLIHNPQDQPVGDSMVTVIAEQYSEATDEASHADSGMDMPGMGGHSKTASETPVVKTPTQTVKSEMKAGMENGEYQGELNLGVTGHWMIKVNFSADEQEKSADFAVEIKSGSNLPIVLSFAGVNAGIISVAAIVRKNSRKNLLRGNNE